MGFYTEKDIEIERLREENARLFEERQAAWECAKRTRHERDEARAELARVAAQRDIALVHGPEDMIRALEELTRERDEARAEAKRYHDALVARHGGEPVALLEELDASRAEVSRLREEWQATEYDSPDAAKAGLEMREARLVALREENARLRQRVEELELDALSSAPPYYRKWEEAYKRAEAAEAEVAEKLEGMVDLSQRNVELVAEVARLEGLILDWHMNEEDAPSWVALVTEARRIRAAKGE